MSATRLRTDIGAARPTTSICHSWHDLFTDSIPLGVPWAHNRTDRWLLGVPARVAAVAVPQKKPLRNQRIQGPVAQLVGQVPQTLRLPERQLQLGHLGIFH